MIIQSKRVYISEKLVPAQIDMRDGKIFAIYEYDQFKADRDYGELMLLPGLCDTHVHGYDGESVFDATRGFLEKWTAYLPSEGVTSVVAGISCHPKDKLIKACNNIGDFIDNPTKGAEILGVYEEGPFISLGKEKGAQNPDYCIIPDKAVIDEFMQACRGHLIYVMIAPEMLNGNYEVIDYCRSLGLPVSLGHTGASFDICEQAIAHGASSFTHTFNGMKGLHHREPGVLGAAMYFDQCYCELVADGVHVEKHAANILARIKGKDKLIIITDSVQMKGLPYGTVIEDSSSGRTTVCEDGVCRLDDGTIAGSVRRLNQNLCYAIKEEKIDFVTAVNACTVNPMRLLGINDRGIIREGYKADIVAFDEDFEPQAVYINGQLFQA